MKIFKAIINDEGMLKKISTVVLVIPILFQLFLSSLPFLERLLFILYSFIFLIIGFLMIYAVLGFQVILKIASRKWLSRMCDFFCYLAMFSLIIQYLANLRFIHNVDEAISIAFLYTIPGVIAGCYRIKNKYTK